MPPIRRALMLLAAPLLLAAAASGQSISWLGGGATSFGLTDGQLVSTATNICTATDVTATFVDTSGRSLTPFPGAHTGIAGASVGANLDTPATANILTLDFGLGRQVENLSLTVFDVDQSDNSGSSWTDRVRVVATLAGAPTAAAFACLGSSCSWRDLGGGVIEGDFNNATFAAAFGQAALTIAGPVDRVEVRYVGAGPGTSNQYVGYGPLSFACSATPAIRVGLAAVSAPDGRQELAIEASRTEGVLAWQVERWQAAGEIWTPLGTVLNVDGASLAPSRLEVPLGLEARGSAVYRVLELDARGAKLVHGPFTVTARAGDLPARATGPRGPAGPPQVEAPSPGPDTRVAWAETVGEGIAAVSLSDLPPRLRRLLDASGRGLEIRGGGEGIPYRLDNGAVFWLARRHEDLWTRRNGYRFAEGSAVPLSTEPRHAAANGERDARQALTFEQNLIPAIVATTDAARDYWYWSGFLATAGSATRREIALDSEAGGTPSEAFVTVELAGVTAHAGAERHRARIELNGRSLGTMRFDGRDLATETFSLPEGLLQPQNVLAIEAELAEGQSQSIFLLDRIHLGYLGARPASSDRASFEAVHTTTEVAGFSAPDVVAIADRPEGPRWVEAKAIAVRAAPDGTYSASIPTEPGVRYHVAATAGVLRPTLRAAAAPPAGLSNRADLVLITPSHLLDGAEGYAELRRAAGVATLVVDLQYVYDHHSDGRADPWAIRGFLRRLASRTGAAPAAALLIGNGTFDPRDFGQTGDCLVPTPMRGTAFGLFSADNLLGDLDGDGQRETLIARLPVTSASQLASYAAKVELSGDPRGSTVFFADNADPAGDFPAQARAIADLLDGSTAVYALGELSLPDLRDRLFEEWSRGPQLLSFVGHGGATLLAEEGLLLRTDVQALERPVRFLLGLTCIVNRHEIPGFDSLGEALVLAPAGGALVTLAPTGLSYSDPSTVLGALITDRLGRSGSIGAISIGEGVLHGLNRLAASDPSGLDALYTVLGDPTLALEID